MTAGIMHSQRSVISVDPLLDKINHVVPQALIAMRNCVTEISPGPFSQKIVDVIPRRARPKIWTLVVFGSKVIANHLDRFDTIKL
jgi:hypothetical protein